MIKIIIGIALSATLTGCLANPDAEHDSLDPTYTEMAVHLNADGTRTVTTRTITLSEELRENAEREGRYVHTDPQGVESADLGTASAALVADAGCASASFWLYDQVNRTGNKVCFSGTGVADLHDYSTCAPGTPPYQCISIASLKKSYWAGTYSGYFQGSTAPTCVAPSVGHCTAFSTNQASNTLTSCENSNTRLNIGPYCRSPTVSQVGQSPMGGQGYLFTVGGSVKGEIFNGAVLKSTQTGIADANGSVSIGFGNPMVYGSAASCGETLKFTDVATGLTATTSIFGACF